MFINFTNHNNESWNEEQLKAAYEFGKIEFLPFPEINPNHSDREIFEMARTYSDIIISKKPNAVLCQGEMTFAFAVVSALISKDILVFAATTQRVQTDGTQKFKFVKFRRYIVEEDQL